MAEGNKVQIPRVKLGSQGLEVSKLGFGCMGLTGVYNSPVSEEDGIAIIKDAFNKGITFFDTADMYGANANEVLVGKALKQLPREKVQLATKFGIMGMGATGMLVKGTPEYVRACCKASLERLGVEYIDLYYQHRVDTSVPIEETVGELKKLVEEGKIKYIGLSEAGPDTIRRAHTVHPITAVQLEWSLWTRDIEEEIIPVCRELGIGIVPYSPLGRGFFGGKAIVESMPANSSLTGHPRFQKENLDKNRNIYLKIENLAKKHRCTPAQLALAWVLQQGDDVVPIPDSHGLFEVVSELSCAAHMGIYDRIGKFPSYLTTLCSTTKIKNLDNNIGSLRVKLSAEDLKEITDSVPIDEVAGDRTYENMKSASWRFTNTPTKDQNVSS